MCFMNLYIRKTTAATSFWKRGISVFIKIEKIKIDTDNGIVYAFRNHKNTAGKKRDCCIGFCAM